MLEEAGIMRRPEMLDQADAGDPVELAFDVAIILELELDPVGDAQFGGALVGEFDLVGGERDAEHVDVVMAVEVEREPAPAAADVEHLHARLEIELGGDVRLLVELRLLEAVRGVAEIGAGILAVLVEEQLVEPAGEVVGMLGIAPRAACQLIWSSLPVTKLKLRVIGPLGFSASGVSNGAL